MPEGRPPLFTFEKDCQKMIDAYFNENKSKPTITGLALYMGFASRQSFYDYEKSGEFSYIIKRARLRIENKYEEALHGTSPTGAIFALKNFGWKDKQEVEQSGGITIKFENPGDYIYPTQDQSDSGIPESV
jgi:hypothetical protein